MGGGGVTALLPHPGSENPGKGENSHNGKTTPGFPPLSPFPGSTMTQIAAVGGAAAALDAVRAYRRTPTPKPPRKPRRSAVRPHTLPAASAFPGVPLDWYENIARLGTVPAPEGITPHRWQAFQATAARLLRDHGAELHAAGWDALDLFGLHRAAPATYPPGWSLAWLLNAQGEVLDVGPDVVGLRCVPDGARLAFQRQSVMARAGTVPAWTLTSRQGGTERHLPHPRKDGNNGEHV